MAIDSNPAAARVAVFGLYLALLEELEPPTVWETAVLPQLLGRNVVVADAFDRHSLAGREFDIVVGNPPWQSKLTPHAEKFIADTGHQVADRQLAQAFLWLAADMLRPGGMLGLIMPSKGLLHNRSRPARQFRLDMFHSLHVRAIIDLSAVRRTIFTTAIAPAAVLVAAAPAGLSNGEGSSDLLHVAAHPRSLSNAVDALIITPEEVRSISANQARTRPDLWRVLLWGSPRDLQLLDRLQARFPTVRQLASERQWEWGQGYQVGGGDANDASEMLGLPIVETDSVLPLRIAPPPSARFDLPTLHRPREFALYKAPHVLVRRTIVGGRLAAALLRQDAVFPNGVLGVAGPEHDELILAVLAATIVSSVGHYWHFMTSASWGVERDFVELNEHLSLPLALPRSRQGKRLLRLIELAHERPIEDLLPALDDVVFDVYELTEDDRLRVLDRLAFGLDRFRRPRAYESPVDRDTLNAYQRTLREALSSTLPEFDIRTELRSEGPYRAVTVTLLDSTSRPERANLVSRHAVLDVDQIVRDDRAGKTGTTGIVAQPAGFFVDEDTIYIVKTADIDRWSYDAALDDAGRILAALAFGD